MTALAWLFVALLCAALVLLTVACRTNLEVSAENRRLRNRLAATERDLEQLNDLRRHVLAARPTPRGLR